MPTFVPHFSVDRANLQSKNRSVSALVKAGMLATESLEEIGHGISLVPPQEAPARGDYLGTKDHINDSATENLYSTHSHPAPT